VRGCRWLPVTERSILIPGSKSLLTRPSPGAAFFILICYRFLTRQGIEYLIMPAIFSRLSSRAVREKEIEGKGMVVLAATRSE